MYLLDEGQLYGEYELEVIPPDSTSLLFLVSGFVLFPDRISRLTCLR